jgi:hypothetical protein
MPNVKRLSKDVYTEAEAAATLGITVSHLHQLLDQHIFTEGPRPAAIEFTSADLVLLKFWAKGDSGQGPSPVLQMPRRR